MTGFVASLATAAPSKKRQAAAAPVFTAKTFAELSIAGGTAGDAAAEAQAALAGLPEDLTTVAPEDIEFLSAVNSIANDAGKHTLHTRDVTRKSLERSLRLHLELQWTLLTDDCVQRSEASTLRSPPPRPARTHLPSDAAKPRTRSSSSRPP